MLNNYNSSRCEKVKSLVMRYLHPIYEEQNIIQADIFHPNVVRFVKKIRRLFPLEESDITGKINGVRLDEDISEDSYFLFQQKYNILSKGKVGSKKYRQAISSLGFYYRFGFSVSINYQKSFRYDINYQTESMDYIISGIGSIYCERPQAMDYLFGPIASSFKQRKIFEQVMKNAYHSNYFAYNEDYLFEPEYISSQNDQQ